MGGGRSPCLGPAAPALGSECARSAEQGACGCTHDGHPCPPGAAPHPPAGPFQQIRRVLYKLCPVSLPRSRGNWVHFAGGEAGPPHCSRFTAWPPIKPSRPNAPWDPRRRTCSQEQNPPGRGREARGWSRAVSASESLPLSPVQGVLLLQAPSVATLAEFSRGVTQVLNGGSIPLSQVRKQSFGEVQLSV